MKNNTFKSWLLSTYEHNELADIATHGCASCAPSGMIYYTETEDIFNKYKEELFKIMSEYQDGTGQQWFPEYVLKNSETWTGFCNSVVWFCAEVLAYEATQGEYIEEVA